MYWRHELIIATMRNAGGEEVSIEELARAVWNRKRKPERWRDAITQLIRQINQNGDCRIVRTSRLGRSAETTYQLKGEAS